MPDNKINFHLEACVTSLDQAIRSEKLGAHRIEICTRLETAGMTPDITLVNQICMQVIIPIRVMIRPNPIGFDVNDERLQSMIDSITHFKLLPIEGFVIGVLKNNTVDRKAMELLLNHASPYPITFHKAIDLSSQMIEDIHWMNAYPVIDTILTSGGATHAADGIGRILEMKSIFNGKIMAGGKITPDQISSLHQKLSLSWYHGRAIVGDLEN